MSKVVIIGGGAAGMAAAIGAAECGHDVSVYEKNEKLGKKIYITGKGRCNVTNSCDTEDLFSIWCPMENFYTAPFTAFPMIRHGTYGRVRLSLKNRERQPGIPGIR